MKIKQLFFLFYFLRCYESLYSGCSCCSCCSANKRRHNNDASKNLAQRKADLAKNFEVSSVEKFKTNKELKKLFNEKFAENGKPHIGLDNIGATCYMNATLQCFAHIKNLAQYFKYYFNRKNNVESETLSASFKTLIDNLWPDAYPQGNSSSYSPNDFKNKISKMNPLFKGVAANDAKDLVNFIIMTIHEELNTKNSHESTNINVQLDQRNEKLMFDTFCENFKNTNSSIVSDLFYGSNRNVTQCGGCNVLTYNYQIYFFLIFPLEEVRKFKLQQQFSNQNNMFFYQNNMLFNQNMPFNQNMLFNQNMPFNQNNTNGNVTLIDCFEYDKKVNIMAWQNKMYCNYCKRNCVSYMCTQLATPPKVLILLFNRGKGIEFEVKCEFSEKLDLTSYFVTKYSDNGIKYKLIGVVTHIGESGMGGHFIATCKDPFTNKWYRYNDAIVSEVSDFNSEVVDYAMPYLLFYQVVD